MTGPAGRGPVSPLTDHTPLPGSKVRACSSTICRLPSKSAFTVNSCRARSRKRAAMRGRLTMRNSWSSGRLEKRSCRSFMAAPEAEATTKLRMRAWTTSGRWSRAIPAAECPWESFSMTYMTRPDTETGRSSPGRRNSRVSGSAALSGPLKRSSSPSTEMLSMDSPLSSGRSLATPVMAQALRGSWRLSPLRSSPSSWRRIISRMKPSMSSIWASVW